MTSNPVVMRSVIRSIWQDLCDGVEEMGAKAASAVAIGLAIIFAVSGLQPIAQASTPTREITPIVINAQAISSPYALYPTTIVTPSVMKKWLKVAHCETNGNWKARGHIFSGGLGITNYNWAYFGGRDFAQNASQATPEQQVLIATHIQTYGGYKDYVPDQYGYCSAW